MVEDKEKKEEIKDENSIWKSIVEEVKKQGMPIKEKSIENTETELAPKYDIKKPESIEKVSIEESIEIPEEKSIEKISKKEEHKKISSKEQVTKPVGSKFTTIMITKELKERLAKKKEPKESYGDVIQRLLEK